MTFHKPKDISYTNMCIYIDDHAYSEDCDWSKVYEYLYLLIHMLAEKQELFSSYKYYDGFAIYGANRIYLRLTNAKQFEVLPDGTYQMEKLKSVLNYIKSVLYPMKVEFEQLEYSQTISEEIISNDYTYNFNTLINRQSSRIQLTDFKYLLDDVGKTCKAFLLHIPYLQESKEWLNIYVSVMLTFLNMITLPKPVERKLCRMQENGKYSDEVLATAYRQEDVKDAILFHLPGHMSNYILVLARQLRKLVAKDLSYILHTKVTNDFNLVNYLQEEITEMVEDFEDED